MRDSGTVTLTCSSATILPRSSAGFILGRHRRRLECDNGRWAKYKSLARQAMLAIICQTIDAQNWGLDELVVAITKMRLAEVEATT